MIVQALQIMLFGMLGIFLVMGIIIGCITLLKRASRKPKDKDSQP